LGRTLPATAITSGHHFARGLTCIDLNRVRAGVVDDPADWTESDNAELRQTRQRSPLVDHQVLEELLGLNSGVGIGSRSDSLLFDADSDFEKTGFNQLIFNYRQTEQEGRRFLTVDQSSWKIFLDRNDMPA
jgi:hypothetical protein